MGSETTLPQGQRERAGLQRLSEPHKGGNFLN